MDSSKLQSIYNFAKAFEKKAQAVVSAQAGEIQSCLEQAKLWQLQNVVSPLLNTAGVPDDATVNISILVGKGDVVAYNAVLEPNNPKVSTKLNAILKQKFSIPMSNALKAAKLDVTGVVLVKWLTF
jgi:hypothetical protein